MKQSTKQPERRPRMGSNIVVSCEQEIKDSVDSLAISEDRTSGAMARILIKEALRARGVLSADDSQSA